MLLTLTRQNDQKLLVEVCDEEDGKPIATPKIIHRYKDKEVKWLANLNPKEWTIPDLNLILQEVCQNGTQTFELDIDRKSIERAYSNQKEAETEDKTYHTPTEDSPFVIHVRGLSQTQKNAIAFQHQDPGEALKQAFHNVPFELVEPIIEWFDNRFLCCLDIDYHDMALDSRPSYEELKNRIDSIKCQPFCWHMSHGQGAKLYYIYKPGYYANELASIAGLQYSVDDPRCTFDLTKSSRHPCYTRESDNAPPPLRFSKQINFVYGSSDVSYLKRIISGDIEQTDIEELLADKGWRLGASIPHTECPINPSEDTKAVVFIGERGLYCHKCAARGLGEGEKPGFYSYVRFMGKTDNRLLSMVKGFVHIEHARIVLSSVYPRVPLSTLETTYRCLLKIVHGFDDPRINKVFYCGGGYIRSNGLWKSLDGSSSIQKNIAQYVMSLPGALVPTDKGFVKNIPAVTAFCNTGSLENYGYHDIDFIRGCKISGQFMPSASEYSILHTIVRREFRKCKPQYVTPAKRMPHAEAWALIESMLPGISRQYLRLLIAAKGAAEGRQAQCPFILVAGPSGAGKSTTVQVAAGICGDIASEPTFSPWPDRFRQNLMEAAGTAGFVVVNEIFKEAERAKLAATQALDPMLTVTEESLSHKLFIGSVRFGLLPPFVLTDVTIPEEVTQDMQIARRFTFIELTSKCDWEKNLVEARIQPHQLRLVSPEHAAACDSVLSEVIDQFFTKRMTLAEIAKELGIVSLSQYTNIRSNKAGQFRQFYEAVCQAPPHTDKKNFISFPPAMGWKRIDRLSDTYLKELWDEFCNGRENEKDWAQSRTLSAEDWGGILGLSERIAFEVVPRKQCVFVRFIAGPYNSPTWINGREYK